MSRHCSCSMRQHFNSQPHEEADIRSAPPAQKVVHFNSQPHEEADEDSTVYQRCSRHFNSQPHEEADELIMYLISDIIISTHSLTKRLTILNRSILQYGENFNSQPHEEADGNFRQKYIYLKLFFTLIAHINLVFYSNHYIVNFFLVKYTHFLVRMS